MAVALTQRDVVLELLRRGGYMTRLNGHWWIYVPRQGKEKEQAFRPEDVRLSEGGIKMWLELQAPGGGVK